MLISVVFTCKGRPALTELCLRRFKELMPEPYELFICYNGVDEHYMDKLQLIWAKNASIVFGDGGRFHLINEALDDDVIQSNIEDKKVIKKIYVKGKLVNIVVK